ncbi:beta-galactosidase trimerization domain-containing protein [candidate division KSB1 bacterium]|nr:beta-galactosidase trimerization domain-containing protein [candidate division KSB1 bacterium]
MVRYAASHTAFIFLALGCVAIAADYAVRDFRIPAKTSIPFTYCIWYLPDPDGASFLEELSASPPDLFHVGYHIPFKGGLGPTYGHDLYTNDILPPNQIPREVERIQNIIQCMREAGVTRLIPYVYTMAFFGRADQRVGFFNFYDHWEDYRAFGLGPKPAADPELWSQVRGPSQLGGGPEGILHYEPCINHPAWAEYLDLVVRELAAAGYDGMFFDVNTLYCYCPHCQEKFDIYLLEKYGREGLKTHFGTNDHRLLNMPTIYRDVEAFVLDTFKVYLKENWESQNLTRLLGIEKADQVKLEEDWRLLRCYIQGSRAEFPPKNDFEAHLAQQFGSNRIGEVSEEQREKFRQVLLRQIFHTFLSSPELAVRLKEQFGSADLQKRCCTTPRELLLWVETQRFWCKCMADQFARLKAEGRHTFAKRGRSDDFYTVANLGSMATRDGLNKRRVDGIDLVHWAPMADMQMFEEMHQPGSLESGVIFSNIFAFRWAMAAGTRAGTLLYEVMDDCASDLAHAEVAAGGGGAFIQAAIGAPEARHRWRRFYADHADLWDGGTSWARAGLLFWSDQVFYENSRHLALTRALVHVLSETQIPFDLITEENPDNINQYQVLFAPALRYLSDPQIERILNYANQGGNLIVIEPFGSEDKYAALRNTDPLEKMALQSKGIKPVRLGKGSVIRLASTAVPARQSDYWCLMEERANEFVLSSDFLNEARRKDIKNGVDLGQDFVRQIETALGLKLRWCPESTDPGIYLHAYRLPKSGDQPERIVAHVVNYRVPILLRDKTQTPKWTSATIAGEPVKFQNLRITIPLPKGANPKQVELLNPTEQASPVKWTQKSGAAQITLPELKIYKAIVLKLDE